MDKLAVEDQPGKQKDVLGPLPGPHGFQHSKEHGVNNSIKQRM